MSFAEGALFTDKGKILHAKAIAGAELVFTRLAMGDGELGSSQSSTELTALISEKLSVNITGLKVLTGGMATVKGVMSNTGLAAGFYWREIGLFATDPDDGEILYCYGNAGTLAEYIPAGSGSEILEKVIGITAIVSNVASVSATIAESMVYATQQDLQDHINNVTLHGQMYDSTLAKYYKLGVDNGLLYIQEVTS